MFVLCNSLEQQRHLYTVSHFLLYRESVWSLLESSWILGGQHEQMQHVLPLDTTGPTHEITVRQSQILPYCQKVNGCGCPGYEFNIQ